MTFSTLRALHAIIGDAIDEIEHIYARASAESSQFPSCSQSPSAGPSRHVEQPLRPGYEGPQASVFPLMESSAYVSPPPSPHVISPASHGTPNSDCGSGRVRQSQGLDFPSLDAPYNSNCPSEFLTADPTVVRAINFIIAAAGQLSATVQAPFLSICEASMAYHLPSCIRLLEASHTVEILREAGPAGLHVSSISKQNGVEKSKLAHVLRLLATHHIIREVAPDVFAINRISSVIDTGKRLEELRKYEEIGRPELKYKDTNGIAAFTGLCTDEIHKSSAYLTEAYFLSPSKHTREAREPTSAPFCFAFSTLENKIGFFNWLEGEGSNITKEKPKPLKPALKKLPGNSCTERGPGETAPPALGLPDDASRHARMAQSSADQFSPYKLSSSTADDNPNRFRLERFGKAMSGTGLWEAPGAIFNGFDWHLLPQNSIIVDVGGGIGSTSMVLASAFSSESDDSLGLKFVIQDRPIVVEMGEKAWKVQCPELLKSGTVNFQVHDFFTPQPVKDAAVFLLRVVLHDWPDDFARQILLQLRHAANENAKLLIADFVLPLACPDNFGRDADNTDIGNDIEGAEESPVPTPLIANLGKASTMVYDMDLTMQAMFNSQERTLREIVALTRSAGWKVTRVAKADGSHFGHITAIPVAIPRNLSESPVPQASDPCSTIQVSTAARWPTTEMGESERQIAGRNISRCGTPTFGSSTSLPSFEEAIAKFGGRVKKSRLPALSAKWSGKSGNTIAPAGPRLGTPSAPKKRPSPLSILPQLHHVPLSSSPARNRASTPRPSCTSPILGAWKAQQSNIDVAETPSTRNTIAPTSPQCLIIRPHSPRTPSSNSKHTPTPAPRAVTRRSSQAQLYKPCLSPAPPLPSSIPVRVTHEPATPTSGRCPEVIVNQKTPTIRRRASCANLTQPSRRRADSHVPPLPNTPFGVGRGISMGGLLSGSCGAKLQFPNGDHDKELKHSSTTSLLAAAARIEKGFRAERSP